MPSLTTAVPKYRKKKVNGCKNSYAVVLPRALGPDNSRASKAEYDRLKGQFIASGRSAGFGLHEHNVMTRRQLVIEYSKWAKELYIRADGTPTGTHQNMRSLMTLLLKHYGSVPVTEFRALAFRDMVGKLTRNDNRFFS